MERDNHWTASRPQSALTSGTSVGDDRDDAEAATIVHEKLITRRPVRNDRLEDAEVVPVLRVEPEAEAAHPRERGRPPASGRFARAQRSTSARRHAGIRPESLRAGAGKSSRRLHRHALFFATPYSSAMSPRPSRSGARVIAAEASSRRRRRLPVAVDSVYRLRRDERGGVMATRTANIGRRGNPHEQARAYYRLCDEARALGISTSLDDPRSPRTVAALRRAVAARRQAERRARE